MGSALHTALHGAAASKDEDEGVQNEGLALPLEGAGDGVAIGIDLGTTNSCVAVYQHGRVHVIANERGHRTTPSCVAFTDTQRLVGHAAKDQVQMNPENTVFDVKRLIGRKFDDPKVQQYLKHWPFMVVSERGKPMVEVEWRGERKRFSPEQLSAMVLGEMRDTAEAFLGVPVRDAVVTVPAYFNDAQRQATKDAGAIAGLNVLRVLNEPTAAALAYGLDHNLQGERNVLVFDLGGGTFDASILTITEGSHFEVKATAGNTHLGGEDFDNQIVGHIVEEFTKKFGIDLRVCPRAMRRLRTACEKAKCTLSTSNEACIDIDNLYKRLDFHTKITRSQFEKLCGDLFRYTLMPVENALHAASMVRSSIHDVVLVGGSTRIPKIQQLLRDFFHITLNQSIDPDEAVAYGAAVQAAILSGNKSSQIKDLKLVDVVPLSLGIETAGGFMATIVNRNTPIPCRFKQTISTYADNQTNITVQILEGERFKTEDNNLLGTFELTGISPKPHGVPAIEVTFDVDANGILTVSAVDKASGLGRCLAIYNRDRLSPEETERMLEAGERFKEEDEATRMRVEARSQDVEIEDYALQVREAVETAVQKLSQDEHEHVAASGREETIKWMDQDVLVEKRDNKVSLLDLQVTCGSVVTRTLHTEGGGGSQATSSPQTCSPHNASSPSDGLCARPKSRQSNHH